MGALRGELSVALATIGAQAARISPLQGGDLSQVVRVTLSDGRVVVGKSGALMAVEARMLARVPALLACTGSVMVIEALAQTAPTAPGWANLGTGRYGAQGPGLLKPDGKSADKGPQSRRKMNFRLKEAFDMRLVRNTPEQLVLAHSPWGYALLLGFFAVIFVISGLNQLAGGDMTGLIFVLPMLLIALFFTILVRPVRVIFDRPSQSVEIIKTSLGGRRHVTHGLGEISHATLLKRKTSKGFTHSQMHLVIAGGQSQGHHPISDLSGARSHYPLTDAINAWLGVTPG